MLRWPGAAFRLEGVTRQQNDWDGSGAPADLAHTRDRRRGTPVVAYRGQRLIRSTMRIMRMYDQLNIMNCEQITRRPLKL